MFLQEHELQTLRRNSASQVCPTCKNENSWKDGFRKTVNGKVQRFLCRECGFRFSGSQVSNNQITSSKRQVCDILIESKNSIVASDNKATGEISDENRLFTYAWHLKKIGRTESTIETYVKLLRIISKRGADLEKSESVKNKIAEQKWTPKRKENAVNAYTHYLQLNNKVWDPPHYKEIEKPIFIPKETEIDDLIAGTGLKTSVFLQCLKETGARAGEILNLKWSDVDFESNILRITPEKGSRARVIKVTKNLINRLGHVKKVNRVKDPNRIFGAYNSVHKMYSLQKKNIARKLGNDRLLRITFHTLRHWHATKLYHETKDIYFVQRRLGHKRITNTMKYIHLADTYFGEENDEFIIKVAENIEQAIPLVESGYTEAADFNGVKIFKMRKSKLGRVS